MSWKGISRSLLTTPCSEKNKTAKFLKLFPYCADYFGHKLHMYGNKKLVMHGVKYVLAFDCHSHFITAFSTVPIKNDAIIYDEIYWYFF